MKWWLPLIGMVLLAPFTPWLDQAIEHWFFTLKTPHAFVSNEWTEFVYSYLVLLAEGVIGIALLCWVCTYLMPAWKKWRTHLLMLILPALMGAGLVVHAVLKDHWGRPRPKQTIEFGGMQEYRPFYKPNFFHQPEPSKSFPCGHCSMGFYFFAIAAVGKRLKSSFLYHGGIFAAWVLGTILGVTRMAQGGHFLSDVLVSALILWWVTLASERWIYGTIDPSPTRNS